MRIEPSTSRNGSGIFGGIDSSTRVPTGARARGRKRQRGEIEPAMRHSCLTLTPIDENFSGPATDSEDSTDSDMPELDDAGPLTRRRSEDGRTSIPLTTDRIAQIDAQWANRKKEKRRSRSTGWKHFPEPGGGHIDYSKVPSGNRLRALVLTLKKNQIQHWAHISRSLGCNPWCGASMICQTNDVALHKDDRLQPKQIFSV